MNATSPDHNAVALAEPENVPVNLHLCLASRDPVGLIPIVRMPFGYSFRFHTGQLECGGPLRMLIKPGELQAMGSTPLYGTKGQITGTNHQWDPHAHSSAELVIPTSNLIRLRTRSALRPRTSSDPALFQSLPSLCHPRFPYGQHVLVRQLVGSPKAPIAQVFSNLLNGHAAD